MNEFKAFYDFLNSVTPFSRADFENSAAYFKLKSLAKGDIWIGQNSVCREIAFINDGALRSYYIDHHGNDVSWCFCVQNTISSSFKSFLSQEPSDLSIQALSKTELITIDYSSLQILYKTIPVWQEVNRLLLEKEYLAVSKYASSLNTESAREKYLRLLNEQPSVLQHASVQDIASYLGVSRETLSRIRKQVAKDSL